MIERALRLRHRIDQFVYQNRTAIHGSAAKAKKDKETRTTRRLRQRRQPRQARQAQRADKKEEEDPDKDMLLRHDELLSHD